MLRALVSKCWSIWHGNISASKTNHLSIFDDTGAARGGLDHSIELQSGPCHRGYNTVNYCIEEQMYLKLINRCRYLWRSE